MVVSSLPSGKLPVHLLRQLLARGGSPPTDLLVPPAIGEDAAAIRLQDGALIAATDPITLTSRDIGGHSVVINANDVAVMGARPRWFLAVLYSVIAVIVELFLNAAGVLTWDYAWWSARFPLLIVIFGYLTFFVVAFWVHDMETRRSQLRAVAALYAFDGACLLVFGPLLGWI